MEIPPRLDDTPFADSADAPLSTSASFLSQHDSLRSDAASVLGRADSKSRSLPADTKRNSDWHDLFPAIPGDEALLEDWSCAWQREILIHGRMYLSERHICFCASIFGYNYNMVLDIDEMVSVEKKSIAGFIPNSIEIATMLGQKYYFASFIARDHSFDSITRQWGNTARAIRMKTFSKATPAFADEFDNDATSETSSEYLSPSRSAKLSPAKDFPAAETQSISSVEKSRARSSMDALGLWIRGGAASTPPVAALQQQPLAAPASSSRPATPIDEYTAGLSIMDRRLSAHTIAHVKGLAELAESSPSSSNPASPTPASSAFSASLPEEIQRNIHIVHAKHVVTPPPPALLLDPLAPVDAPSLLKSVLEPKIPIVEETDPPGSPDSSIIDLTPHLAKIEERKKAAAAAHAIAAIPTPRVGSTASPSPDAQTPNTPSPTTRKLSNNDTPTSASAFFETTGTIVLDPSTPSSESIHAPHEPSPTASPISTTATLSQPVPETTDGIFPVQLDPTTLLISPTPSTATTPSFLPPAMRNAQLDSILSTPVNPESIEWTRPVTSSKPTLESAKSVASSPIASTSRERTSRVEEAADPIVLIPRRNPASRESSQDARSVHSGVSDSVSLVRELEGSPIRVGRPVLIGGGSGGTRSVQPSPVRRSQSRDVQRSLSDQMKSGEGGVAAGGLPPLPNTPSPQQQKRVPPRLVKKTISPVRTEMDAALASTEKLVLLPIARTLSFNDNDSTSPVSMDSPGSIASLAQEDHSSDSHSTTPPKLASPVVVSETPLSPNRASPPPQPCACKSLSTVSKYTLILTSTFAAAVTMETTWEHVYATRASTARFLATRGVKGFKSSGWKVSTDLEAFTVDTEGLTGDDEEDGHVAFSNVTKGMERRSEYVMPLTNPMGPKETRCYVREVVEFKDADGVCLVEYSVTPDVPSGRAFWTKVRKCWRRRGGGGKVGVEVGCEVEFVKSSWIQGIIQAAVMDGMKTYYKDYNAFLHETFASSLPRRPHKPTTGHATPTTPHTTPSILDTKHQLSLLSQQQHDSHHHHHHPLQDEMDQLDLQAQNGRIQRVVELLTLETVARDGIAIHPSGKLPKRGSSLGDGARKGGGVGSKEFWEAVWVLWRGLTGRYWIVGVGVLVGVLVVQVGVVVGVVRVLGGRGLGEEEVRVLVGRAVEEAVKRVVVQGGVVGGERERGEL
ncbi:hypothetical protein HDU98_007940 [Podochytrium sp. JEL0797]|nr:hypothetical protein HDU98_007940 [Podochytrium sp. JEL0797]